MAAEYRYTRGEMETHVRFDAEEKIAHIYTADPSYIRKLDKLVVEHPEAYACVKTIDGGSAKMYEAPSKLIRFANPPSAARIEAARRNGHLFATKASNSSSAESRNDSDE